ncbi:MAG: DNA-directed RNA polymerase subunit omega, partial [Fusobacteria bacterium]
MKKKITHDELLEKIPNKYELAITIGKRYGQLVAGATPLVPVKKKKKETLIEITNREIVEDKIRLKKVVGDEVVASPTPKTIIGGLGTPKESKKTKGGLGMPQAEKSKKTTGGLGTPKGSEEPKKTTGGLG